MKYITSEEIRSLDITPRQCVEWVETSFLMKDRCQLPPKISLHPHGDDFINTMPCLLPEEYHTFGCKVVSRITGAHPALRSEMMVFDSNSGQMKAVLDADWITAKRTGAVAALAINTFRKSDAHTYAFIGLGAMAYSTLECFFATNNQSPCIIKLKRYKDQAEKVIEYFSNVPNVTFEIVDTTENLVDGADVVVSAITVADGLLIEDTSLFKSGVLVVPIHTRGFQNCDIVFDKVFADDEAHVKGFKYFNQFRQFAEIGDVLKGETDGRTSDIERILSYNIGLGLHDAYFAFRILNLLNADQQ